MLPPATVWSDVEGKWSGICPGDPGRGRCCGLRNRLCVVPRQRRQRGREDASKSLFVYAIALMVLGFAALGAGLFALEVAQYHAVSG
jgi:hypothetical protein